jgi:GntR family transcriptional regulator
LFATATIAKVRSSEMAKPNGAKPMYKLIAQDLRAALEEGRFSEDERLPTEAELRTHYGVSRHTIRQAFQDLVSEGLIYRLPGQGTFVTGLSRRGHYLRSVGTIEDLMAWSGTEMRVISPVEIHSDQRAASRLKLPSEEVAVMAVSRFYEGEPFVVTYIYLPPEIGRLLQANSLPDENSKTVIGLVEQFLSSPITDADQCITVTSAPADVAKPIDCAADEPVMYVERRYFDSVGKPVELAISYYNPKRYSYRLRLRRKLS